jgi:hypothetical protein
MHVVLIFHECFTEDTLERMAIYFVEFFSETSEYGCIPLNVLASRCEWSRAMQFSDCTRKTLCLAPRELLLYLFVYLCIV